MKKKGILNKFTMELLLLSYKGSTKEKSYGCFFVGKTEKLPYKMEKQISKPIAECQRYIRAY